MPGTPPRAVGLAAGRRTLIRLAASLVAVAAALGGMSVPAAAADPFDLRIHPDSTSRYVGEYGDASLDFCTTEPAYTSIEVHDASGTLVERIRDDEFNAYACDFTYYLEEWDRLDDEGSRVPAGLYTVTFRARSESGATDVETVQIGVYWEEPARYTYLPVIHIDQPFEVEIQLEPWFFELATVTDITLWCNDFRETALVIGSVDGVGTDGRASVPGDPAPCAPGDSALYCAMTWLDPFGFEHTWSCSQTTTFVAPIPTGLEIGLVYRYSWPEEHFFHLEGPADVSFCLSAPAIVDAVVVDEAGTVVRTLASGESFPASPCDSNPPDTVLTWDYRDEAGGLVPDGEYQVEMAATAQSGSDPPETASRTLRWHVWNLSPGEWVRPVPGSVLSGSQTAEFHRTPGFDAQFPMTAYAGCSPVPGPSPAGTNRS